MKKLVWRKKVVAAIQPRVPSPLNISADAVECAIRALQARATAEWAILREFPIYAADFDRQRILRLDLIKKCTDPEERLAARIAQHKVYTDEVPAYLKAYAEGAREYRDFLEAPPRPPLLSREQINAIWDYLSSREMEEVSFRFLASLAIVPSMCHLALCSRFLSEIRLYNFNRWCGDDTKAYPAALQYCFWHCFRVLYAEEYAQVGRVGFDSRSYHTLDEIQGITDLIEFFARVLDDKYTQAPTMLHVWKMGSAPHRVPARPRFGSDVLDPEHATRRLNQYVGGYLHELDLTRSAITGSAIAASVVRTANEMSFDTFTDFLQSAYPTHTTAFDDLDAYRMAAQAASSLESAAAELASPASKSKKPLVNYGCKFVPAETGYAVCHIGKKTFRCRVDKGSDVDIAVFVNSSAELDAEAEKHFLAIQKCYPNAVKRRVPAGRSHKWHVSLPWPSSLESTAGSLESTAGSLESTAGSLESTAGSLESTAGSLESTAGSLESTAGRMREVEIYRLTPAFISLHHLACVRGAYTSLNRATPTFLLTTSAVCNAFTGYTFDLRYFTSKHSPAEVILRKAAQGHYYYGTNLETCQLADYIRSSSRWHCFNDDIAAYGRRLATKHDRSFLQYPALYGAGYFDASRLAIDIGAVNADRAGIREGRDRIPDRRKHDFPHIFQKYFAGAIPAPHVFVLENLTPAKLKKCQKAIRLSHSKFGNPAWIPLRPPTDLSRADVSIVRNIGFPSPARKKASPVASVATPVTPSASPAISQATPAAPNFGADIILMILMYLPSRQICSLRVLSRRYKMMTRIDLTYAGVILPRAPRMRVPDVNLNKLFDNGLRQFVVHFGDLRIWSRSWTEQSITRDQDYFEGIKSPDLHIAYLGLLSSAKPKKTAPKTTFKKAPRPVDSDDENTTELVIDDFDEENEAKENKTSVMQSVRRRKKTEELKKKEIEQNIKKIDHSEDEKSETKIDPWFLANSEQYVKDFVRTEQACQMCLNLLLTKSYPTGASYDHRFIFIRLAKGSILVCENCITGSYRYYHSHHFPNTFCVFSSKAGPRTPASFIG